MTDVAWAVVLVCVKRSRNSDVGPPYVLRWR